MNNLKPKHICIVAPSLKMGGIERALSVLANYFVTQGYRVSYVSCLKGEAFYTLDSKIQVYEPQNKRTGSLWNKVVYYPQLLLFIRQQVKDLVPDVVLSFGDFFNPLVLLAVKGLNVRTFISDRTSPDYRFPKYIQYGKKWLYRESAGFIAQTQRALGYKQKQFGDQLRCTVIPNAIREIQISNVPRKKIVLYVGRFAWEKGPERLIRAFAEIKNNDDWTLHMAGEGPLLGKMKELTKTLSLAERVIFHGSVSDVDSLLSDASIYVMPSVLEGFPNALCEAMAAGLPCVCFDSIPFEAILEHEESGLVIPDGDISALSDKIQQLMQEPELRESLGKKALALSALLKVEKIGDQFLKFMNL
jgi:GalNAc-alpha-(1->4)-GalNAc-alpha-(1->3)-diNAcBac-PP-undecaprenol alpha-1,4-N-acetyl-D-galactosaminyltransferase